jgi:membrane associated rhomboid family serine protease
MLNNSRIILIASLLLALGGWDSSFQYWGQVFQVSNFLGLLAIVGGVLLAWVGKSPIKPEAKP